VTHVIVESTQGSGPAAETRGPNTNFSLGRGTIFFKPTTRLSFRMTTAWALYDCLGSQCSAAPEQVLIHLLFSYHGLPERHLCARRKADPDQNSHLSSCFRDCVTALSPGATATSSSAPVRSLSRCAFT